MTITKSMAGTGKDYAVLQARVREDEGVLHVQGRGVNVNRDYGVAVDIALGGIPDKFRTWLRRMSDEKATKKSLYPGSTRGYFPVLAKVLDDEWIHLQIEGPALNRKYGASFNIRTTAIPELEAFIVEEREAHNEEIPVAESFGYEEEGNGDDHDYVDENIFDEG